VTNAGILTVFGVIFRKIDTLAGWRSEVAGQALASITEKTFKKNERFGVFNRPAVGGGPRRPPARPLTARHGKGRPLPTG
jgi:hypothetical protein